MMILYLVPHIYNSIAVVRIASGTLAVLFFLQSLGLIVGCYNTNQTLDRTFDFIVDLQKNLLSWTGQVDSIL